ncbi:peptidoglycan editing factor PgeF [Pseudochelatococcus sp. B33]
MEVLEAASLNALSGVRHAFFTRRGGVSEGLYAGLNGGIGSSDAREAVHENRRRMAAHFGLPAESLVTLYQVHSADVVTVAEPFPPDARPKADAMVTARPGVLLGIATADCGPLLFADRQAGVVGAAHAGWKGAFSGVLEATLDHMERLGARRERVTVALGPTISRAAYEVGPEFVARFVEADVALARFFSPSPRAGHAFFDLPAFIGERARLAGAGAFEDLGLCTYADEARFYSFRRTTHRGEPDYGRLIAAIGLA